MKKRYIILFVMLVIGSFILLNKLDNDFMNSCTNSGYSYDYCIEHK